MKKLSLLLVFVLVLSFAMPFFAFASENGGYIVISDENDARLVAAANTLSKYMKLITGKEYPSSAEGEGMKFTVAHSDALPDNGYVIETKENEVSITGSGTRGVIHGVYAFLEKYCGCDWFTSTLYSIPENASLVIPAGEKTEYKPFFEYTDTDWVSPRDVEYSLANGLNGSPYRTIPSELGGNVSYISNFCHTLTTQFCKADTYFDEHPEYFALHMGLRVPDQLCLTNERVYEIVRDEVMALLQERHDPDESLQIISLTQHDNQKMCQCPDCMKLDNENGGHSGTMISFVNRIARDVKAAGYDNVAIDTFAYQYTRKAPSNVKPEDNVIVRLCTIECCFAHALDDSNCSENAALMADLSAWSKICDRIYVWDYTTNYANTLGIFPDFGVLQKNIQVFYENNVVGLYEEGNYYMAQCDGEFGELRAYLLSKLMQDPYADYDKLMNEFLEAFYGKGWESIREFIDMTVEKPVPENEHLMIYVSMNETLGFNKEDVERADSLWENAKSQADTETHKNNIIRSEICWRLWKAYNSYDKEGTKTLIDDIKALGITMAHEGDKEGPDAINFYEGKIKQWGNEIFFPSSIVFYGICVALSLAVAITAMIKKPRKYIYLLLPVLVGVFFEIFGWHRRAYIAWVDVDEYFLTLALIVLLFAFGGALKERGAKKRIISAVITAVVWFLSYEAIVLIINNVIFECHGNTLAIGVAYAFTGIYSIAVLALNLKKLIKENAK